MSHLPIGDVDGVGVVGIDPTPEQLATFDGIAPALAWAGVEQPVWKGLLQTMGHVQLLRQVVAIDAESWSADISASLVESVAAIAASDTAPAVEAVFRPIKTSERAALAAFRRACRLRCGLSAGELPVVAPSQALGSFGQQLALPPAAASSVLNLGSLVDQTSKEPLVRMPTATIRKLFTDYTAKHGGMPQDAAEPTYDQLSAIKQISDSDAALAVDFSLWGSFGRRTLHRLTFTSMVLTDDGSYQRRELPGPPGFTAWWSSWRVFRSAMLLLELISMEVLDSYGELIREFAEHYPWWTVYQADVLFRFERWEKIRSALEAGTYLAMVAIPFDLVHPWNSALRAGVDESQFWQKHLVEVANRFVKATPDDRARVQTSNIGGSGDPAVAGIAALGDAGGAKQKNRSGLELCRDYNKGTCIAPCRRKLAHQCSTCLSDKHPACDHGRAPASSGSASGGGGAGFPPPPPPIGATGIQPAKGRGKKRKRYGGGSR
jgi:hypothetical protein